MAWHRRRIDHWIQLVTTMILDFLAVMLFHYLLIYHVFCSSENIMCLIVHLYSWFPVAHMILVANLRCSFSCYLFGFFPHTSSVYMMLLLMTYRNCIMWWYSDTVLLFSLGAVFIVAWGIWRPNLDSSYYCSSVIPQKDQRLWHKCHISCLSSGFNELTKKGQVVVVSATVPYMLITPSLLQHQFTWDTMPSNMQMVRMCWQITCISIPVMFLGSQLNDGIVDFMYYLMIVLIPFCLL